MTPRDVALMMLKEQIRRQRARLNPDVLASVEKVVTALNSDAPPDNKVSVPYDRAAAKKVIEIYLRDHPDQAGVAARILEEMKKG
ncbi:MAG: hypothetical protein OXT65_02125 [Alphaproteobacteria bacterium]|nr:hypothetical protein [Alphaproteobacteria bacterium]